MATKTSRAAKPAPTEPSGLDVYLPHNRHWLASQYTAFLNGELRSVNGAKAAKAAELRELELTPLASLTDEQRKALRRDRLDMEDEIEQLAEQAHLLDGALTNARRREQDAAADAFAATAVETTNRLLEVAEASAAQAKRDCDAVNGHVSRMLEPAIRKRLTADLPEPVRAKVLRLLPEHRLKQLADQPLPLSAAPRSPVLVVTPDGERIEHLDTITTRDQLSRWLRGLPQPIRVGSPADVALQAHARVLDLNGGAK